MFWTEGTVKERLFNFEIYRNYVADYRPSVEMTGIPKRKRVTFEAWFVPKAIDNADFDEAFGTLTEFQQWLLVERYMWGGYDAASPKERNEGRPPRIETTEEVFDKIVEKTGMTGREINIRTGEAIKIMTEYLNK